jgi:ketosteroid isomerase-like protein
MSRENVDAIRTLYDAAARQETERMLSVLSPTVTVHEPESLPYDDVYRGHEGFQKLFRDLTAVWDDFRFEPLALHDVGNLVVAEVRLTGRAKATGRPLDTLMVELWEFEGGKASACRSLVWDTAAMLRVLGTEGKG